MQIAPHRWSPNFRTALTLLGRSVAALPFGVDEPVLAGAAALELYSGGVWAHGELTLVMEQPQALHAALMAEGFRWTDRPRHAKLGLWNPQLQVSAEVVAHTLADGAANPLATLTLELEAAQDPESGSTSLKVIGLEDLITERAVAWVAQGSACEELAHQIQLLLELGYLGVGGPLRIDYLQRRLADATAGEVVLEPPPSRSMPRQPRPRRITEASMLAAIDAWRVRKGMSPSMPEWAPRSPGEAWPSRKIAERNVYPGREGGLEVLGSMSWLSIGRPIFRTAERCAARGRHGK